MRHLIAAAVLGLAGSSFAETINVPGDYGTIQRAIDASSDGDIVIVEAGTWNETIDYSGKSIEVRALYGPDQTTIDGMLQGTAVVMQNCAKATSLRGFTIKKGLSGGGLGGGLYVDNCNNVTVDNCVVRTNAAEQGAGMYMVGSAVSIVDCSIIGNETNGGANDGGGIHASSSTIICSNSEISNNTVSSDGGGVYLSNSTFTGAGMVLASNTSGGSAGGMYLYLNSEVSLSNCEISDNYATSYSGAFHLASGGARLSLIECTGTGNSTYYYGSTTRGGFLAAVSGCIISIADCQFGRGAETYSSYQGGFAYISSGSVLDLSGTLLANFQAYNDHDGIYLYGQSSVFVAGSTICGPMDNPIYGDWIDKGGNTFPNECPPIVEAGACCTNGFCALVDEPTCNEYHGTFYGSGTTCADVSCQQPDTNWGACCLTQDICIIATEGDCSVSGGAYQGDTTICQSADCFVLPPDTGACCMGFSECVATREAECVDAGGAFAGVGVTCDDAGCPETCLGDVNGDGEVSVNDILTVVANWGPCP
jgi:hypothetical protein